MKIPAKYRVLVYVVATFSLIVTTVLGVVAPEQVAVAAETATRIVAAFATLLALFNITPDGDGGVDA